MLSWILKKPRDLTVNLLASAILIMALGWPFAAIATDNEATDPGGGGTTLIPSGPVTVDSLQFALVKQVRDLNGILLPNGANVGPGQEIYFVLYVDNITNYTGSDFQITDLLNELQFTYIPNSLETTVVPSGSSDVAIWAGAWISLTDALGGPDDTASITDSGGPSGQDKLTIGAVSSQSNQTLNIPGNFLRAIRFRVTVN